MFPFGVAIIIVYTGTHTTELAAAGVSLISLTLTLHPR